MDQRSTTLTRPTTFLNLLSTISRKKILIMSRNKRLKCTIDFPSLLNKKIKFIFLSLYSRADLRKFQALQDLCRNMKDNLEAIKSFKKVTGNIWEASNLKTTKYIQYRRPSYQREKQSICRFWTLPSTDFSMWTQRISSPSWGLEIF